MALKVRNLFSERNNRWEVKLIGELDIETSTELKEKINEMLEQQNTSIIINAEELEYVDSTGLGMLIGILKKLKTDENDLVIVNAKPSILKLFTITGLNRVFTLRDES